MTMLAGLFTFFSLLAMLVIGVMALFKRSPIRRWFQTRRHPWRAFWLIAGAWTVVFVALIATVPVPPEPAASTSSVTSTRPVPSSTSVPTPTSSAPPPTTSPSTPPPSPPPPPPEHTIARVIDGDTVELDDGRTVRLLGVDAPESNTECGDEATEFMAQYQGNTVTVELDPTQDELDRYGRTLAYLGSSRADLSVELSLAGWASYYDVGIPVTKAAEIQNAVDQARAAGFGMWSPATHCADPTYAPPPPPPPPPPADEPDEPDSPKPRTGNSGHPCLPGERDGDGDGFCGEG